MSIRFWILDIGYKTQELDNGSWIVEVRSWILDGWMLDPGYWIGWILDPGHWTLDWILDAE